MFIAISRAQLTINSTSAGEFLISLPEETPVLSWTVDKLHQCIIALMSYIRKTNMVHCVYPDTYKSQSLCVVDSKSVFSSLFCHSIQKI